MCARPRIDMPLLEVTNLRTSFHTRHGIVRAVFKHKPIKQGV